MEFADIKRSATRLQKEITAEFEVLSEESIKEELEERIGDWTRQTKYALIKENPYGDLETPLEKAESTKTANLQQIKNYLKNIEALAQKANTPFDVDFYNKEIDRLEKRQATIDALEKKSKSAPKKRPPRKTQTQAKTQAKTQTKTSTEKKQWQKDVNTLQKLLVEKWRKFFDKIVSEWEIKKLDELRAAFKKRLRDWLKLLQELKNTCDELSMETGFLWDLSKGNLKNTDAALLKKWVDYIKNSKGVKELCNLMGRIKRHEKTTRQAEIQKTTYIKQTIKDTSSKEEIVGLTFGRDLENVLPVEMALLADADTSVLFDMKFVENRLMCFKKEGWQSTYQKNQETQKITIAIDQPKGPIIVCVDTSGSMQGTPENIAKALTLVLTSQAVSQKRDCLLINFSTGIETMELTKGMGFKKLLDFLQKSFGGGTDVAPAFEYALKKMTDEKFEKADLLVVSDFMMGELDKNIKDEIKMMKAKKNRFFSLCVGSNSAIGNLENIFDGEWIYNPRDMNIAVLKTVKDHF